MATAAPLHGQRAGRVAALAAASRAALLSKALAASTTALDFVKCVKVHEGKGGAPPPCPPDAASDPRNAPRFAADVFFVSRLVEGLQTPTFGDVASIVGGAGQPFAAAQECALAENQAWPRVWVPKVCNEDTAWSTVELLLQDAEGGVTGAAKQAHAEAMSYSPFSTGSANSTFDSTSGSPTSMHSLGAWGTAMTSGTTRSRRKLRPGSSTGRAAYSPKVGGKAFIQVAQKPLCLRSLYAFVRKHGGHAELCSSSRATSYSAVFKRMRALEPDTARSKSAPNRLRKAYAQFLMPLDGALGGMGCPAWSPLVSCALHMDLASRHFTRCWGQLVQGLGPAAQAGLRECLDALLVHADVLMAVERQNFPPTLASTAVADALVLPWLWEATEDPHCAEVPHQHSLVQVIATALQRGLLAQGPATLALCRLAVAVRDSPLHSAPALLFLLHTMGAAQAAKGDGTGWLAHTPCTGVLKLKVRHPRAPLGSLFPPLPPAAAGLGAQGLQDAWAAGALPSPGVHATASNNSANTLSVVGVAGALRSGRAPADAPEWRSRALWAIAQLLLEGNNRETVHLQLALPQEQRSLTPPLGGSKRARETAPMPPPTPPPAPKRQALHPGGGLYEPQSRFGAPVRSVGLPPAWPCAPLPYAQVVGGTTSQLPHAAMMRAASMAYATSHAQSMAPASFPRASPNTITAVSALNGLGGAAMATPVVEAMVASARQSALSRATSALGAPRHVVSHVMDGSRVLL